MLYHKDSLNESLFVDSLEHDNPEVIKAGLYPLMKVEVSRLFDYLRIRHKFQTRLKFFFVGSIPMYLCRFPI